MPRFVKTIRRTLLVVGEGDAEALLLGKLKASMTSGGRGPSVTVRNAKGKGALHVVSETVRHARQGSYNVRAAIFDTDTDWNDGVAAKARKAGVIAIPHHPCLEAVLLSATGQAFEGSTAECKRRFERAFGGEAHQVIAADEFDLQALERSAANTPSIAALLALFA